MLSSKLTEDVDESVGEEVTIRVWDVALVHSAGANLNVSEDDRVVLHFSADICR